MTRLRQNGFMLGLAAAVALAWIFPGPGARDGWLHPPATTKAAVAIIFFAQGLTLSFAALRAGALRWRLHALVQGFTFILFPVLGLVADRLLGGAIPPDLRLGFLYLCVLPTTITTSVALTAMAGGNTAGALFNATLSNVLGVVVTPLWAGWLMRASGATRPLGPVILEIVLLVLLPMALGQMARARLAAWADDHRRHCIRVNNGLVLFMVYAAFCESVQNRLWSQHGLTVVLGALAGAALLLLPVSGLAWAAARALRFDRADRIAAVMCSPTKTLANGVPMAQLLFGAPAALGLILLPLMLYHLLQLTFSGVLAARWGQGIFCGPKLPVIDS